ncbi:MAG TPA: hypothetical protein VGE38_17140 [Nocardioides sp.]|uniref:hypothetical protein n=1 Tax=Nocardioides sp. TaxID=35761 RepID=UPI002EDAD834
MNDDELVRRLLAEARHDEPMPADVADRLDAVLAELGAERSEGEPDPAVSSLAARRATRGRAWTRVGLVAAAAAVVGGVAVGQFLTTSSPDASQSSTDGSAGGSVREDSLTEGGSLAVDPRLADAYSEQGWRPVSSQRLAADVRALVAGLPPADADSGSDSGSDSRSNSGSPGALLDLRAACAPAAWGPGELVPVMLDGTPAVLAVRPPDGSQRRADLLACGTGELLASVPVRQR